MTKPDSGSPITPVAWMRDLIARSPAPAVTPLPPAGLDQPGTLLRLPEGLAERCGLDRDAGLCLAGAIDGDTIAAFPARLSPPDADAATGEFAGALLVSGAASPYAFSESPRSGAFLIDRAQPLALPRAVVARLDLAARRAARLTPAQQRPVQPTQIDLRWRRLAAALATRDVPETNSA